MVTRPRFVTILRFMDILSDIEDGQAIAVAVSGGPDSMALCWLLSQKLTAQGANTQIHALTVDHGIRDEAKDEAQFVKETTQAWGGVSHVTLQIEGNIEPDDTGLMARARDERYKALAKYCEAQGIKQLYVAHHADDQAETVLLRLCKGSGLDGLSGMASALRYNENLEIIRPLLSETKDRLVQLCVENDISYIEDPTNKNLNYSRNHLRHSHEVLAKEGLDTKRIVNLSKRLSRARLALDFYAERLFFEAVIYGHEGIAGKVPQDVKKHAKDASGGRNKHDELTLELPKMQQHPHEIFLRVLILAIKSFFENDDYGYGPRLEKLEALSSDLYVADVSFRKRTLGGLIFSVVSQPQGGATVIKIQREK